MAHRYERVLGLVGALALAGCGGGGGGTSNPAIPTGPAAAPVASSAPAGVQTTQATFRIAIPSASAASALRTPAGARKAAYISAGTKSIQVAIAITGYSASAFVNVGSSNCVPTSSGQTCTLALTAPLGTYDFTVTTFDQLNATGNVLSQGVAHAAVALSGSNAIGVTLSAAVASVAVQGSTQYLPAGVAGGSVSITLVPYDDQHNVIAGPYGVPITLTADPGLQLSTASIGDATQNTFTATYNGIARTRLHIAIAYGANGTTTALVIPTSHVTVAQGTPARSGASLFRMIAGPDGNYYFSDIGPSAQDPVSGCVTGAGGGAIGQYRPATGQIVEVPVTGFNPVSLAFNGSDLYFTESQSGAIGRIVQAASGGFSAANYSRILLPHAPAAGATVCAGQITGTHPDGARDLVIAGNTLYASTYASSAIAQLQLGAWTGGTAAIQLISSPYHLTHSANYAERTEGMILANDGNVYVETWNTPNNPTSGPRLNSLSKLTPVSSGTPAPLTTLLDGAGASGATRLRFGAQGPDGNLYLSWVNTSLAGPQYSSLLRVTPGGTNFTQLALPAGLPFEPDSVHAGSGSTVVFSDLQNGAIGVYDTVGGVFHLYPPFAVPDVFVTPNGPQDVQDAGDQSYYFTVSTASNISSGATNGAPQVNIGHLILAEGWQLLPEGPQQIDGIGGWLAYSVAQSTAGSAIVAVTSGTPSVCSVSPAGASFPGLYAVTSLAPGTCTVNATDQNSRTVSATVTVTGNTLTLSSRARSSR